MRHAQMIIYFSVLRRLDLRPYWPYLTSTSLSTLVCLLERGVQRLDLGWCGSHLKGRSEPQRDWVVALHKLMEVIQTEPRSAMLTVDFFSFS